MIGNYHEVIAAFSDAIRNRLGNAPQRIVADGKKHRFSANGKTKDLAGWYILHLDQRPAGAFGSWRGDVNERWRYGQGLTPMTPEERDAWQKTQEMKARREEKVRKALADRARRVATRLWSIAERDVAQHPYIIRKRIGHVETNAIKVLAAATVKAVMLEHEMKMNVTDNQNILLVPMFRLIGKRPILESLQWIDEDGQKRFLTGTQKRGLFCAFGGKLDDVTAQRRCIDVVEGFATGVSVFNVRQRFTVCAFDSGNLLPVIDDLVKHLPNCPITVIADNDRQNEIEKPEIGNVGVEAAKKCRVKYPTIVNITKPKFPPDAPLALSDFNDLQCYLADIKIKDAS